MAKGDFKRCGDLSIRRDEDGALRAPSEAVRTSELLSSSDEYGAAIYGRPAGVPEPGRRDGFRCHCSKERGGSNPSARISPRRLVHPSGVVARALRLASRGLNAVEISREIAVPRRTVADWLAGKIPTGSRTRKAIDPPWSTCKGCGRQAHDFDELPHAYVYLLGMYLGDGCLSKHNRGVFRLRITLDAKYPRVISETEDALRQILPDNIIGRTPRADNCLEVNAYSKALPCFFPQHGPGKKHERRIVLADWQSRLVDRWPDALLRGLIHSDGCRFMNTGRKWRHPRYSFSNVSEDIKAIFCDACDRLGLHHTRAGPKTIYVSRKADVAVLDRIVGPKR